MFHAFRTKKFRIPPIVAAFLMFALSGCASICGPATPGLGTEPRTRFPADSGWWYVRFKIDVLEGSEAPRWYMDALLAREVVAPVLQRRNGEVFLWRFHRRAAQDAGGHQLSFIFYSEAKTARRINREIRDNPLLAELKAAGAVVDDMYDDPSRNERPGIEDTSDKHWSQPVQVSWPYFIMGVSEMWLELVSEMATRDSAGQPASSIESLQELYRKVNTDVEQTWEAEGGHALLHHLNALFGYQPVVVRGRGPMQF